MLFLTRLVLLFIVAEVGLSQVTRAEMIVLVEQSSSVTLSTLTQQVYERHPARHQERVQEQQINANADLANATFSGVKSIRLNHQNDVISSHNGLQEWEGSVDLPLWLPGQKQQQWILSNNMSAELLAYQQQIKLAASAKVRELVWNVVSANNATEQAYQVWQTAQKLAQDVTTRVKAGELAGTERLLASANVLEMHSQYLLVQAELEHALKNYQQVTGQQVFPQQYEEVLAQEHDLVVVSQQHPSLILLKQQINTLRTQQELAHFNGAVKPNLSVGVRRERSDHEQSFNNSIGVGISFALDNNIYSRPAIANAAKKLVDVEIAYQQLERELNITLLSHLHDLKTKQRQHVVINKQNETTQQYLALQQRAFELGELDLASLLRSQVLANEIRNRKLVLEIDIKHTISKINQTVGIIL